jgi:hypothetical protein
MAEAGYEVHLNNSKGVLDFLHGDQLRRLLLPVDRSWVLSKTAQIIYNKFGTNVGSGDPELQVETTNGSKREFWTVPLEVDYPRIIDDQVTRTRRYVVFHLGKLAELRFDANRGKPLNVPNRALLSASVERELIQIRDRVERLMVRTASYKLAKLVSLKHMMSPLANLITSSLRRESYTLPDVESTRRRQIQKYVDLLVDRKFLVHDHDVVEPSPDLWLLFERLEKRYSDVIEYVFKDIIENAYEIVYKSYNIRILHPYVQISSSYYDYALSAQDLVALSEDALWEAYSELYKAHSERRRFRFDDYLRELSHEDVNILEERQKGVWQGNREIFEKMRQELPIEAEMGIVVP